MSTVIASIAGLVLGAVFAGWFLLSKLKGCQRELAAAKQEQSERQPKFDEFLRQMLLVATQMDGNVERHTEQLTEINDGLKEITGNDASLVIGVTTRLIEANAHLQTELHQARQQIADKQRDLETFANQARIDTLTGLNNRRMFDSELSRQFAQRQRQGTTFSLLMIDIDHFKRFNDRYGHLAGDLVLRSVAQVMTNTLRDMDLVCRYGGEEFAVICSGSRLPQSAAAARRVCLAIEQHSLVLKNGPVRVTVSIGVAEVAGQEIDLDLIERADKALYAAKKAGRNQVFLHSGQACEPLELSVTENNAVSQTQISPL